LKTYDAIVIGTGSMGSATAYEFARRGRRVLALDQFDVPNVFGAYVGVTRIIRLAYAEHPKYVPLLRRSYELWRDLQKVANEQLLFITGGVDAGTESSDTIKGSLQSCREHALPHECMSASDVNRRFPGYCLPSEMVAVYQPDGGFLMSERCVVAHVNAALAHGAEVHGRERVRGWDVSSGRVVVTTDHSRYEAGSLVLTAGPWTPSIATDLAQFVVAERQVLLWAQPRRPEYFEPARFPIFNMEATEGRYYGFPVHHVPGFKIGKYHHRNESVAADSVDRDCYPEDEAVLREGIRRYFPDADGPTLAMKACMFANTPDSHFIIDHHPEADNVIIAAGFSGHGFKFCGVVGEIAADLALEGATKWDLELFRMQRLAGPKGPALHGTERTRPTRHS
jgi:sarcosine oxidase